MTKRIPLSPTSIQALRNFDRYDLIVFTSKNAKKFFAQELKERHTKLPRHIHVIQVGPRVDLLKFPLSGKRILFPHSALAPYDIVRKMRARGAMVRVVPLYTAYGMPLSQVEKKSLLAGRIEKLYFKSPSGIDGLLRQVSRSERKIVLAIPVLCIGETTSKAARKAGFRQVSIKNI